MTDRAYGYYELNLFDGKITLPLKFCASYASNLAATAPTKTGLEGRATNRIYILAKPGTKKVEKIDQIEKIIPWNTWETYINAGTTTKPVLKPLSDFPGLEELLEQNKERSKEREIDSDGFYELSSLKPWNYTGRHFHTYPHKAKVKDSEQYHMIYNILGQYLEENQVFLKITFFGQGEELGALYYDPDSKCIRIAGLHANSDLKPVKSMLEPSIKESFKNVAFEKFNKLKIEGKPSLALEWRDFVKSSLEAKGVFKKVALKKKAKESSADNVMAMFESLD